MYKIYCDGRVLHDPMSPILKLISPACSMALNSAGSMSFRIAPNHPFYNNIVKRKSVIELYSDDTWLFSGFAVSDTSDDNNIKTISVEGELSYLNDSVQPFSEYHNMSVENYFSTLISNHNSQVDNFKKFTVGTVNVVDSNDSLYRQSNYEKTKNAISDKLISRLGGYIRTRHFNNVKYIDYIAEYNRINSQGVAFGRNLIKFLSTTKADTVANVIIPLGAKLENSENRLDITSVNDGKNYVEDTESIAVFGRIVDKIICDDVTLASNLKQRGFTELNTRKYLSRSIKLIAVDLHQLGGKYQEIFIGDLIPVKSSPHGIDTFLTVSAMTINISNPDKSTFTMDKVLSSLTDSKLHADKVINTIYSDYVKNETLNNSINKVNGRIETNTSLINQTADELLFKVEQTYVNGEDFESYKSSSQEHTAEQIEFKFTQATDKIQTVEDYIAGNQQLLEEYIRFKGALIELGRVGNDFTTELDNTALRFKQAGNTIAYISNNKLYITDAEITNSLRIGKFAFIPRSNGNLSFKWIGG